MRTCAREGTRARVQIVGRGDFPADTSARQLEPAAADAVRAYAAKTRADASTPMKSSVCAFCTG
ncbi:hypothetical protein [Streptomyces noursei]|uniref:hypothetical protein n=1 Tax=Streptomyces noursei TaxID=1971 RepID=UPI0009A04C1F